MKLEIKNIFHKLFAIFVNLYRVFPVKNNRYTFIMTHDSSEYGNVGCMKKYILERDVIDYIDITKEDYVTSFNNILNLVKLFFYKSYYIATSKCILLDNAFLPLAYCNIDKNTKVIQLWHGSNAIKRFGQTVNKGLLKKLEKKLADKYTYLVLNSENTREKYKEAFGVTDEQILITGCPRVDIFFDEDSKNKVIENFYRKNKNLMYKKIILYAPTFKDNMDINNELNFIYELSKKLGDKFIIIFRIHPSINSNDIVIKSGYENKVLNYSKYKNVSEILILSDILITDYSSIIFDYMSITNKNVILYSYDLDEFIKNDRGIYNDISINKFINISVEDVIYNIHNKNFYKIGYQVDEIKDSRNRSRLYKIINE